MVLLLQRMEKVSNEITRASVQNPLEYRNIAETAVAIGPNRKSRRSAYNKQI